MARYINLDELLTTIDKNNGRLPSWLDECIVECKCYFDDDVAPVKHGHWILLRESEITGFNPEFAGRDPIGGYQCSNCKKEAILDCNDEFVLSSYCPNCGAKMDGGVTYEH